MEFLCCIGEDGIKRWRIIFIFSDKGRSETRKDKATKQNSTLLERIKIKLEVENSLCHLYCFRYVQMKQKKTLT